MSTRVNGKKSKGTDHLKDDFLEELNKRVNDFESKKIRVYTWKEVKKSSRQS